MCTFLLLSFFLGCKKEDKYGSNLLIGKWNLNVDALTRNGADACQYNTKPSDLDFPTTSVLECVKDNIYEYSTNTLTVSFGNIKCRPDEPAQTINPYERTDSTLTIGNNTYKIVLLTKDTLIIDRCLQLKTHIPNSPPVAPSYVRIASKFYRLK